MMDMDLLRPGTVPISKDTIMWFEFLLKPDILDAHLKKNKPDPSPTELITKFLTISADINFGREVVVLDSESECDDKLVPSRRSRGLKILALRTAAREKWDLDILESKLLFPIQWMLLQDLLHLVHSEIVSLDLCNSPDHVLFAVSLYHRWALRVLYNSAFLSKLRNGTAPDMLDERLIRIEQEAEQSIQILLDVSRLPLRSRMIIPSEDTFVPLVEDMHDKQTPNWSLGERISSSQFICMILMDLGTYLFSKEDYVVALESFERCKKEFEHWSRSSRDRETQFFMSDVDTINGYITACQVPVLSMRLSLTDRFLISVNQHYEGILAILSEDNLKQEIPVSLRENLELDIAAAISSGGFTATRDLVFQIQSLNTVYRRAQDLPCLYNYAVKLVVARRGVDIFVWALKATMTDKSEERMRLAVFVLELLDSLEPPVQVELKSQEVVRRLIRDLPVTADDPKPPQIQPFLSPDFNNTELKNGELENQLLTSYEPMVIKDAVVRLAENNAMRPAWQIESKWELGTPLHGIVSGIPSNMLQHYLYVLLGKAEHMDSLGRYDIARRLLVTAEAEVSHHGGMMKLAQLIAWEIFLVESHSIHVDWPHKNTGLNNSLVSRSLTILEPADSMMLPRVEVVEQAAVTLLNLGEWEALTSVAGDKRLVLCELSASLAQACTDICKFKGNKKVSRAAWDLIVPVFGSTKRGLTHETPLLQAVVRFFSLLREWTVLSAAISLVARLHNVLRDESSLELICEYSALWPSVVSNTSSYSVQLVSEHLVLLVNSALEYYPDNVSLHKLLGDYYYINSHHSAAMKEYLLAAVIATDNFSRPLTKTVLEDGVYKRMIKSLGQLNCHTQAGVLCQFLEEVDYNTAFKSLTETGCHDCMDTYYDCIWDVNILEYLIYLQNKRGNRDRAKQAIDRIGLLELNANNNEEIKREAANKRKVRFMQALVRQYVL